MDLPAVRRSFADIGVVGFYKRSNLTTTGKNNKTIVYSDRTEYSAYAERCQNEDPIVNRKNAAAGKILTKAQLETMNFRDFAETVNYTWIPNKTVIEEDIDPSTSYKMKARDINSGHWIYKLRQKRRHVRFSTVLYTDLADRYDPLDPEDESTQTSFFSLSAEKRKHLCRSYMELVCYVPWHSTPDNYFLSNDQRAELDDSMKDPEKDHRYSRKRLTMFFEEYVKIRNTASFAPPMSLWRRDNQFSYTMFLTNRHNRDIHIDRMNNKGVLRAQFEGSDELEGTGVDIQPYIYDEVL